MKCPTCNLKPERLTVSQNRWSMDAKTLTVQDAKPYILYVACASCDTPLLTGRDISIEENDVIYKNILTHLEHRIN